MHIWWIASQLNRNGGSRSQRHRGVRDFVRGRGSVRRPHRLSGDEDWYGTGWVLEAPIQRPVQGESRIAHPPSLYWAGP